MPTNSFSPPGQAIKCSVLLQGIQRIHYNEPWYVLMLHIHKRALPLLLLYIYTCSLSLSPTDVDGCTVCKDAFKVGDKLRRLPC